MTAGRPAAPIDCGHGHACQFCPVEATCALDKPRHNRVLIEARLRGIDQIVLVLANKGGVGKSTVAANLAAGLARRGFRVGIADADVHGPNQSRFFGFAGARVTIGAQGLAPRAFSHGDLAHPVRVGSLAFLLQSDDMPVVWRDAYKHDFVHHLVGSFDWGPLDFLIVDMPPGTGNELITLCDLLEGATVSALLVTTPQSVALMDSLKAVRYCQERGLPLLGAVENMAGVVCPHCSGAFHVFPDAGLEAALAAAGVARLGRIPLLPALAVASDDGVPVVVGAPDSLPARAFAPAIAACADLGRRAAAGIVAREVGTAIAETIDAGVLDAALQDLDAETRATVQADLARTLEAETDRLRAAAADQGGAKP